MMYKDLRVGTRVSPSAANAAATVPELTLYVLTVGRRRRAFYLYNNNIYIYYYNVCQTLLLYVHKYSERIPHSFEYIYVYTFIYLLPIYFRYTSSAEWHHGAVQLRNSKITTVYNALISCTRTRVYYLSFIIFLKTCLCKCVPESYAFITICIMLTIYIAPLWCFKKNNNNNNIITAIKYVENFVYVCIIMILYCRWYETFQIFVSIYGHDIHFCFSRYMTIFGPLCLL